MILILFMISSFLLLFEKNSIQKKFFFGFILLLYLVILTYRNVELVPDTKTYFYIYENSLLTRAQRIEDPGLRGIESGYIYFLRIFKNLKFEYTSFLFFNSLLMLIIWLKMTKKIIKNVELAFFIFLPFYSLFYFTITIRSGLANLLAYCGVVYYIKKKNIVLYYIIIAISAQFHTSMVVYFLLPPMFKIFKNINKKYLYLFILGCFMLSFFKLGIVINNVLLEMVKCTIGPYYPKINRYIVAYAQNTISEWGISIRLLKNLIIGVYFIALKNRLKSENTQIYNYFLIIFLIGIFFNSFFSFIKFNSSRIGDILIFYEFILFTMLYEDTESVKERRIELLVILLNSIVMLLFLINWIPIFSKIFIKI